MGAGSPSRWRSASITVCSAALLAGCGGSGDRIEHVTADRLARQSDAVAASLDAHDGCGAAARLTTLRREARAAMAGGEVPERLQPPLRAAVARLEAEIVCTPPPPAVQPPTRGEDEGNDEHSGKGKGHGKGKGRRK